MGVFSLRDILKRPALAFMSVSWLSFLCSAFAVEPVPLKNCSTPGSSLYRNPLSLPPVGTSYYCVPTKLTKTLPGRHTLEPNELFFVEIGASVDNANRNASVSLAYESSTGMPLDSLNQSCVREPEEGEVATGRVVEIHTDNEPFFDLVGMQFRLRVADKTFLLRFYRPGLHLVSHSQDLSVRSNFTLTEIQSIIFLSVLVLSDGTSGTTLSPATSYRVCERNTTTGQFTNVGFSVDKRQSQMEDPVCSTFDTPLRSTGLLVELMIIKTNAILDARCYDLVITTEEECSNMSPDATNKVHFTICNLADNPVTTTITLQPSVTTTDPTTDGGGLTAGAIAAVVICTLIGAVIVGAAVIILAVFFFRRRREQRRHNGENGAVENGIQAGNVRHAVGRAGRKGDAVMDIPQQTTLEETDNAKRVHMLFAPSALKSDDFGDVLVDKEGVSLGELPDIPQNGRGYDLQLIALLRKPWCQRLYIVYQDSPEWLKANDPTVWKCISILQSRPLDHILNKVVLVRVYDKRNGDTIQDIIEGPILTVNICRHQWDSNPKECAELLLSKVRLNQSMFDEQDGISRSATPPHTGNPITAHEALTQAPPYRTPPPPIKTTQYTSRNQPKLTDTTEHEILKALQKIEKHTEKISENTGNTAKNTENSAEKTAEVRDITTEIHNLVVEGKIDREAPDNN